MKKRCVQCMKSGKLTKKGKPVHDDKEYFYHSKCWDFLLKDLGYKK